MKQYKADISVKRVGITTAPRIPRDHPSVRHSSCLTREVFPAPDIAEARQRAIALVENPNTPEFQECLDFYFVPFKILQWEDWQDPIEPEGTGASHHDDLQRSHDHYHRDGVPLRDRTTPAETQIHSCESHPFLVGVFKWIVKILVYEK